MVIPENIHASVILQNNQVVFGDVYVFKYTCLYTIIICEKSNPWIWRKAVKSICQSLNWGKGMEKCCNYNLKKKEWSMNGVRCFFHAESIAKEVLSALCSYYSLRDSNVTEDSLWSINYRVILFYNLNT